MNLRLHERFPVDSEVRVTNLTRKSAPGIGWILDVSKSGIALLLRTPFDEGDLVQFDVADCELFGHVIYVQDDNGSFRTGVAVEQVLLGRSDLTRLIGALSREAPVKDPNAAHHQ
jgi:hypothetical protein